MKPTKMAKCNKYKYSFCTHKHDAPECKDCPLIKRHSNIYIYKEGKRYKKCPHCGEYKLLSKEFTMNSNGNYSWCKECTKTYARIRSQANKQVYMIGYKDNGKKNFIQMTSLYKTMVFVKKYLSDTPNSFIEIKRIK